MSASFKNRGILANKAASKAIATDKPIYPYDLCHIYNSTKVIPTIHRTKPHLEGKAKACAPRHASALPKAGLPKTLMVCANKALHIAAYVSCNARFCSVILIGFSFRPIIYLCVEEYERRSSTLTRVVVINISRNYFVFFLVSARIVVLELGGCETQYGQKEAFFFSFSCTAVRVFSLFKDSIAACFAHVCETTSNTSNT